MKLIKFLMLSFALISIICAFFTTSCHKKTLSEACKEIEEILADKGISSECSTFVYGYRIIAYIRDIYSQMPTLMKVFEAIHEADRGTEKSEKNRKAKIFLCPGGRMFVAHCLSSDDLAIKVDVKVIHGCYSRYSGAEAAAGCVLMKIER